MKSDTVPLTLEFNVILAATLLAGWLPLWFNPSTHYRRSLRNERFENGI